MCSSEPVDAPFVRAFIAVEIDESVRRGIVRVQDKLKNTGAHVSWVRPENIHLSLEFLGDLARDRIAGVSQIVDEAGRRLKPFRLEIQGVGSFGRPASPRVIWAGVETCPDLVCLRESIRRGLIAIGIKPEARPFRPHLTIGRVRSSRGRQELAGSLPAFAETGFGGCEVGRVTLMRSILCPSGPEYTPLHFAPFGG